MKEIKEEFYNIVSKNKEVFEFIETNALNGYFSLKVFSINDSYLSKSLLHSLGYLENEKQFFLNNFDRLKALTNLLDGHSKKTFFITYSGTESHFTFQHLKINNTEILFCLKLDSNKDSVLDNELIKTKEILSQISKDAKIGGWEYNLADKTLHWSDITKQIHEVDEDYIPDLNDGLFYYKEGYSRETINTCFYECLEKGTSYDLELELITAKGNEVWVKAIGNAEFVNNKCKRIYGTFQDISNKKKIEAQNEINLKIITDLTNELPGALYQFEMFDNGKIRFPYVSSGFLTLFGLSKTEIEESPEKLFELIHPDDIVKVNNSIAESALNYTKWHLEFRVIINREILWIKGDSSPEKHENGLIWHGYMQNITEKKKAELEIISINKRFELATQSAQIGVWEISLNKQAVVWNDVMYAIYEADLLVTKNPYKIFKSRVHPEDLPSIEKSISNSIMNLKDFNEVFRILNNDNTVKYLKASARIQFNENNEPTQLVGITYDITAQKISEKAIQHAKEIAEAASLSKSEFLANMSHEIRTPLNGVIGFIDLLMKTKLDQIQLQYMETVFKSANSLLDIINDILDFSKIEAGKLELSMEEIDLFDFGSQVTDIIKFQAHSKGLEVLLKIPPIIPELVLADSVRLRQILVNLLGNAIKFTENGEIELRIDVLGSKNGKTNFRFSVRDTGVGIDKKNQSKIFEAFSQEDATISRKFGGTGLGLTISNKLLDLMGSKLQINSEIGLGSVFFFDVELNAKHEKKEDWKQLTEINKILIVDDNTSNRLILKQLFSLRYVQIDLAKNGIEALDKIGEKNRYDLILMDYNMPYLDGIETVKNIRNKLKKSGYQLPIILLNNSTYEDDLDNMMEELFIQYRLVKPVKMKQLYDCLVKIQNKDIVVKKNKETQIKSETNLGEINILIADDNPINMMLTRSIFSSIIPNAIIQEAQNGIEAVSKFVKHKPDIVFMDIQMPEMNGYNAAKEIRKFEHDDSHVPIIALTAGTVKGEKEKCLRSGMDDYISKPVITDTIVKSIEKWLDFNNGIYKKKENMENNNLNKHFDLEKLKDRLDNDIELINQLMIMTREYLVEFMPSLELYIKENNKTALKSLAHKMKGTALSVCFTELALLSLELEKRDNFDDYNFVAFKSNMAAELDFLVKMIDENYK
jgi:PAS domain S-box-containing protein